MKVKFNKYYIEFVHVNSDAENYDMQSTFFDTKKQALKWLRESFVFIDDDVNIFVMTVDFYDENNYDIVNSEKVPH